MHGLTGACMPVQAAGDEEVEIHRNNSPDFGPEDVQEFDGVGGDPMCGNE